ncbi:uncharacterized protein GGS22DRAFT_176360 [Annulohypoxylon maeteangense]|uniref:uncharacterized protein n=1 Tax=Annulohypoxylon maeteangense TaxID=1927788 RepID=UPI00200848C1|nr:uncharacterized protein GGS22DRAFT_176360 [Annulohypoxylon maeteangense]KAI0879929.1 hypothetical protein GGS22DRAFT_176360 [Annulohypoxylon maeteangense]
MASSSPKPRVYRLRGCPIYLDRSGTAELLSRELGDVAPSDIAIQSLATNLDPWARPPTKVGTLMFRKLPALIEEQTENNEWTLAVVGLEKALIIDTHFMGITPLNDVEQEKCSFDCIAISGLASHPFGSWQPKGKDKSFMWIRDELPSIMPETRISIYGYDTALVGSKSFQSIQDLAISLIGHIKASGQSLPSAKPLIFLAHSLGGIVLKEAFTILADSDEQNAHILNLFKGGIFFGVPSQGMSVEHLSTMVKGQKNDQMVQNLSRGSKYLQDLDDSFSGLSLTRSMHIYWGYETKMSPTVMKMPDGSFRRAGLEDILVSKESATRNIYNSRPLSTFPINENHSEMVKFRNADPNFSIVKSKLRELREDVVRTIDEIPLISESYDTIEVAPTGRDESESWSAKNLMESLLIPGQDHRFNTIDKNFEHTFEWVFDADRSSFPSWLRDGVGFFWIHGKPGSGKSTLMKFIAENNRTWEHIHKFSSGALGISAMFFFHDRGDLLQKSFEGLLRSIIHQIIDQAQRSGVRVTEFMEHVFKCLPPKRRRVESWTLDVLENCLRHILQQNILGLKIFLLLDALDEYDGQPGFICRFLQDLLDATAGSHTEIKILFSSRPWDEFKRQFEDVASIQLQDYTKDDIENYCWGMVDLTSDQISVTLSPIIPDVIDKANGVFLWVKLALHELISEAPRRNNHQELANILNSIPSDLQKYYIRTIYRIQESHRRDAFVIFEILSKTRKIHRPSEIVEIVECSRESGYGACRETVHQGEYSGGMFAKMNNRILTSTGNLVEVINVLNDRKGQPAVQFIHQTVKEFVRSRDFNQIFLAILSPKDRRGGENGHTFLAKYYLITEEESCVEQLLNHELTTGRSLKYFIDGIPSDHYPYCFDDTSLNGPLALALHCNLQVYLKEKLRYEPDVFKNTEEELLELRLANNLSLRKHLAIFRFILENGYVVKQDQAYFAKFCEEEYENYLNSVDIIYIKATMVVAYWRDIGVWHQIPPRPSNSSSSIYQRPPRFVEDLHQAGMPGSVLYLLDHGPEVTEPTSLGHTALDRVIEYWTKRFDDDLPPKVSERAKDLTAQLLAEHESRIPHLNTRKVTIAWLKSQQQSHSSNMAKVRKIFRRLWRR